MAEPQDRTDPSGPRPVPGSGSLDVEKYVDSVLASIQGARTDPEFPPVRWQLVLALAAALGILFGVWTAHKLVLQDHLAGFVQKTGWPAWLISTLCWIAGALVGTVCVLPGAYWLCGIVIVLRKRFRWVRRRMGTGPRPELAPGDIEAGRTDLVAELQGRFVPDIAVRITKEPNVCRGQACVRGTRMTVWKITQWHRRGKSDAWLLARFPWLVAADLRAAREYAAAFSDEIENLIRGDEEKLDERNKVSLGFGGFLLALFSFGLGGTVGELLLGPENVWIYGLIGIVAVLVPVARFFRKTPKWHRPVLFACGFLGFLVPTLCWLMFAPLVRKAFGGAGAFGPGKGTEVGPLIVLIPLLAVWIGARFVRRWEAEPDPDPRAPSAR
jgi:uncharacterized protein (DUF433 family)